MVVTVLLTPKWQTSRAEEGGTGPTMRIKTLVPPRSGPVLGRIARRVITANLKINPTPVYCCRLLVTSTDTLPTSWGGEEHATLALDRCCPRTCVWLKRHASNPRCHAFKLK